MRPANISLVCGIIAVFLTPTVVAMPPLIPLWLATAPTAAIFGALGMREARREHSPRRDFWIAVAGTTLGVLAMVGFFVVIETVPALWG